MTASNPHKENGSGREGTLSWLQTAERLKQREGLFRRLRDGLVVQEDPTAGCLQEKAGCLPIPDGGMPSGAADRGLCLCLSGLCLSVAG